MSFYRGRNHEIPALNTASLPDLIFSILFFFMLVVHMRKTTVQNSPDWSINRVYSIYMLAIQ